MLPTKPRRGLAKARSETVRRDPPRHLMRARSDAGPRPALRHPHPPRPFLLPVRGARCAAALRYFFAAALLALVFFILSVGEPAAGVMESAEQPSVVVKARIEAIREERRKRSFSPFPKPSLQPRRRGKKKGVSPLRRLGVVGERLGELRFRPVQMLSRMKKVHVGTFPEARRIGITTVALLPAEVNRFDVPWLLLNRVETKSFEATGNRILFSTMRDKASDGIGHGLTVLNAELSTALNLGISYTHRVGIYGSISKHSRLAVENLFGWGVGEVPRRFIEKEVCFVDLITHKDAAILPDWCPVCTAIRTNPAVPVEAIVEIPQGLSYGCASCHRRQVAVRDFLSTHARNNTLFQMSPTKCDDSPKSPDFTLSFRYFYWKYWDMHGNKLFGSMPSSERKLQGQRWAAPMQKRGHVKLLQNELNVAIHARRGDFFSSKRTLISSKAFARVIAQAMRAVRKVGGVFADMPVAIIVYSEGRRRENAIGGAHDISLMDHEYVDSDGTVRDAKWFHRLVRPGDTSAEGNRTHSCREQGRLFPNGVRVEFRISTDVSDSFHEMASADIFIGSPSDFSQYAARVVSRAGMQLLPDYLGSIGGCCMTTFMDRSGKVQKFRQLVDFWRMYAVANEASAIRAMKESFGKKDSQVC